MTEQAPDAPDAPRGAAEQAVLRAALRDCLILVGGLAVLGSLVGLLVAGLPGLWGALIGAALAAFFCATTVWSMLYTVGKGPAAMGAVVMGSWLAKMVVLIVVLVIITQFDFYDRVVLFVVLLLGAVGSALLDYRAVRNGRLPYVEPETQPDTKP
ncbi:hypothetical protein ACFWEJ_06975 [Promicromonospora sp. NPDC060204]|uniref:hypothetical protein n=1 Tax=unclassified Promicromonospora TaxID=2647929 RepID=UPI00254F9348|nr:hypothetical protein [Promicromonospora sp. MEB111]